MESPKNKHCCINMDYYTNVAYKDEHELVIYHPESREYRFMLHGKELGGEIEMDYCPWCGTKLPKSLGDEWCKVVEEELGLKEVFAEEWETLPEEYKTEAWWRKRGL